MSINSCNRDALILHNNKVVCPRCDGNGFIYKAYVTPPSITLYLCDECDALWENGETIRSDNFKDFTTYLRGYGVSYTETQLDNIEYDWYKNER